MEQMEGQEDNARKGRWAEVNDDEDGLDTYLLI